MSSRMTSGSELRQGLDGRLAVVDDLDLVALQLEQPAQGVGGFDVVVGDQHAPRRGRSRLTARAPAVSTTGAAASSGKPSTKSLPWPSPALETRT